MATNKTYHFKDFSLVEGGIRVEVKMDRFSEQYKKAQYWLDGQAMTDMVPLMPQVTNTFINETRSRSSSLQGTGQVVAAAPPMGRFLYEGKGMVDEVTGSPWAREGSRKVLVSQYGGHTNAKENLSYSNPKSVPHWFDEAKNGHFKEWVKGVKKYAGGK